MTAMRGAVVCVAVLFGLSATADAGSRPARSITMLEPLPETARPEMAPRAPRRRVEWRAVDPAISAAVFAPSLPLADRSSIVEREDLAGRWQRVKPRDKQPWRPRVMPHPLSFPTGGGGMKLKIRFDSKW